MQNKAPRATHDAVLRDGRQSRIFQQGWKQAHNLAKVQPYNLAHLQRLFLIEAAKDKVLPLDDRSNSRPSLRLFVTHDDHSLDVSYTAQSRNRLRSVGG